MEDMNPNRDGKVQVAMEVRQTHGDIVVHFDQYYHWLALYPDNAYAAGLRLFELANQVLAPAKHSESVYVEIRTRENHKDVVLQFNEPIKALFLTPMKAYELAESLIMASQIIKHGRLH